MADESSAGSESSGPIPQEGYAGDVDARKAWELLETEPAAVLVDVRTRPEWEFVGIPILQKLGKEVVLVPWQVYPTMELNKDFVESVANSGVGKDATVLFICRSGARSKSAAIAMTAAGYSRCYNVSGGFEGPHDAEKHRGSMDGWKAKGLPWAQG
jgi:rhodanese-related sulfurtransferase